LNERIRDKTNLYVKIKIENEDAQIKNRDYEIYIKRMDREIKSKALIEKKLQSELDEI
jgi:hypothetical protein